MPDSNASYAAAESAQYDFSHSLFDLCFNSEEWKDSMKRKIATNKSRIRGMSA
jgi:hypothetical protein